MKSPANETLAVAFIAIVMIIGMEKMNESKLDAAFDLGTANGKALAQLEIKESLKKQVTDSVCHAWWFGGDTKRVARSIQKAKVYQ